MQYIALFLISYELLKEYLKNRASKNLTNWTIIRIAPLIYQLGELVGELINKRGYHKRYATNCFIRQKNASLPQKNMGIQTDGSKED